MKKSLRKLSICRETLRELEKIELKEAGGAEPTKFTKRHHQLPHLPGLPRRHGVTAL